MFLSLTPYFSLPSESAHSHCFSCALFAILLFFGHSLSARKRKCPSLSNIPALLQHFIVSLSLVSHNCCCLYAELGTRLYCRDNLTMFSDHKVVCYCNITIFIVASGFHIHILRRKYFSNFFWSLRLYYVVALSLSQSYILYCRVPSSAHMSYILIWPG